MRIIWQLLALSIAAQLAAAQVQPSPYQQATSDIGQGNFAHAIPTLENVLAQSPHDVRARNLLGIALAGSGKGEDAIRQFESVLEAAPDFLPALKNLAATELQLGRRDEAQEDFERALRLAPYDPAVHLGLAQIAFSAGRSAPALEHYGKSGGLYLRDPHALLNYAKAALEMNQPTNAREALKRLPPESAPEIHFAAGLALAKIGSYDEASAQFELSRTGASDPYQVDFNLTLARLKSGNFAAAQKIAQRMIAEGAKTTEAYSLLAQAYEGAGRTNDAYEALRTASRINPNDEAAYLELVGLCAEHENYDLGLEIAGIGIRMIPTSGKLYTQRGIVLAMMGRYEDAERDLSAPDSMTLEARPAWIARSLVLMRTGRVPEAVNGLRQLKNRYGDDYVANWLFAEALIQSGGGPDEEAIAALEKSIELNPDLPQSRLLLGKLLFGRGETKRAIEHLEKALALDPSSIPAAYQLARALRKNGNTQRAEELFSRVAKRKVEEGDASGETITRDGLLQIVHPSPAK